MITSPDLLLTCTAYLLAESLFVEIKYTLILELFTSVIRPTIPFLDKTESPFLIPASEPLLIVTWFCQVEGVLVKTYAVTWS